MRILLLTVTAAVVGTLFVEHKRLHSFTTTLVRQPVRQQQQSAAVTSAPNHPTTTAASATTPQQVQQQQQSSSGADTTSPASTQQQQQQQQTGTQSDAVGSQLDVLPRNRWVAWGSLKHQSSHSCGVFVVGSGAAAVWLHGASTPPGTVLSSHSSGVCCVSSCGLCCVAQQSPQLLTRTLHWSGLTLQYWVVLKHHETKQQLHHQQQQQQHMAVGHPFYANYGPHATRPWS